MSLYITSLNSGSNGNCYYIGNDKEAVLVDAGLSCRETERRMKSVGLKMEMVKAIFISHEHGDHIKGVEGLSTKHRLPVYITPPTLRHSRLRIREEQIMSFAAYEPVTIGALSVVAFPKKHDAIDPHSFVIEGGGVKIGVLTDIGSVCTHVADNFRKCNAVFLEANYDEVMLAQGRYPYHLKNRISGGHGHLSNKQALELFLAARHPSMSHILLSHLSKDNNDPDLAHRLFLQHANKTNIIVASRYEHSAVYQVGGSEERKKTPIKRVASQANAMQISLF